MYSTLHTSTYTCVNVHKYYRHTETNDHLHAYTQTDECADIETKIFLQANIHTLSDLHQLSQAEFYKLMKSRIKRDKSHE